MSLINIQETILADYCTNSVSFSNNGVFYVFSLGDKNIEIFLKEIYLYIVNLYNSKLIYIQNNLFIDCDNIEYEPVSIETYEQNKLKVTSVAVHNANILLKYNQPISASSLFNIFYGDRIEYFNDNSLLIYFNYDLFSPFLPIHPTTHKYDPDSKFPNPDWEENTKIMYQILRYPLENFKFVEAYRHIRDAEFEYYTEEQLQANLKKYTGS